MAGQAPCDESVEVITWPGAQRCGVVCVVVRRRPDGAPALDAWVPANVYASINLILEGQVHLDTPAAEPLPGAFATGPFTAALATRTQGRLHSACIVLQPWALPAWCGLSAPSLRDGLHDLTGVAACETLLTRLARQLRSADAAGALAATELPAARAPAAATGWMAALLEGHAVQAVAAMSALSCRQFQRRFNEVLGLPPKTWQRIKRVETAMQALAGTAQAASDRPIAELAHGGGFSDQAHMAREFREATAHGPAQLRRCLVDKQAGYWAFRPAHVRFIQDTAATAAYADGHVR